jgi:hypothetical protein
MLLCTKKMILWNRFCFCLVTEREREGESTRAMKKVMQKVKGRAFAELDAWQKMLSWFLLKGRIGNGKLLCEFYATI